MPIIAVGKTRYLERGILPQDEWEKIKRTEALAIHKEIMAKGGTMTDEDPQVGWDYKKDWRTAPLPPGKIFGSDYDYWNHVVLEAKRLWDQYASEIANDFIAESIAKKERGWSIPFYREGVQVWENGEPVGFSKKLNGPTVDFGPTADFAAFLERWNYSKSKGAFEVPIFRNIGVMHAITQELQRTFSGNHVIYMMPVAPNSRSEIREIDNRTKPVQLVPIIRIKPRHYRR